MSPKNTSSITFDGVSGRMTITGYKGVTGNSPRSIAFWLKTPASGVMQPQGTICYWGDTLNSGLLQNGAQTKIQLISGGDATSHVVLYGLGSYRESAQNVGDGNWHHVCFTWPGGEKNYSSANCYIDGSLSNGSAGHSPGITDITTPSARDVTLGAEPSTVFGNREFFSGKIDDFTIFNVDIGSAGATQLTNSGHGNIDIVASGLFASNLQVWFRMGDFLGDTAGAGGAVKDASGNLRNATTTAGTTLIADPGPEIY